MTESQKQAKRDRDARYRQNKKKAKAGTTQSVVTTAPEIPAAPVVVEVVNALDPVEMKVALDKISDAVGQPTRRVPSSERMQNLMENSVVFVLSFSRLTTKRSLGSDAIEVDADKSMLHVAKDILDSEELRAIISYDNSTAMWFRTRCTPTPWNKGFLMSALLLPDAFKWVEEVRMPGRAVLIEKFKAAYPRLMVDAKKRLKDLFDASQYPPVETMTTAFKMEYTAHELPAVSKKLGSVLSRAALAKEEAKASAKLQDVAVAAEQALATALRDVLAPIVDALTCAEEDGKPKRFGNARLAKAEEFLESFAKFNLTGATDMQELADRAKAVIKGQDAKKLKGDKDVRETVAKALSGVTAALAPMIEDRPARAMTLDDEEV